MAASSQGAAMTPGDGGVDDALNLHGHVHERGRIGADPCVRPTPTGRGMARSIAGRPAVRRDEPSGGRGGMMPRYSPLDAGGGPQLPSNDVAGVGASVAARQHGRTAAVHPVGTDAVEQVARPLPTVAERRVRERIGQRVLADAVQVGERGRVGAVAQTVGVQRQLQPHQPQPRPVALHRDDGAPKRELHFADR